MPLQFSIAFKIHPLNLKLVMPLVKYLGHDFSEKGIEPILDRVRVVLKFPVPTSVRHSGYG